ncbi:MAG: acetyltransferase [Myxococcales bacterium]|nr:acetyltransferase [Myxococcales bacterium]
MSSAEKIVVVGDGESAEIAYEYFTHDSPHQVVAFSAEAAYLKKTELFGLPVIPFEEIESRYDPREFRAHVAISSTFLNRLRARLFRETKKKGYQCVSYVSSHAFVWRNVQLGENCFIFENNVLQHQVTVGDNVVLWSGNHLGHRTRIGNHVFASSHVVISGYCEIGDYTFMGVNSSVGDNLRVAQDDVIGAGAVVVKNTEPRRVYVGNPAKALEKDSFDTFKVPEILRS